VYFLRVRQTAALCVRDDVEISRGPAAAADRKRPLPSNKSTSQLTEKQISGYIKKNQFY